MKALKALYVPGYLLFCWELADIGEELWYGLEP